MILAKVNKATAAFIKVLRYGKSDVITPEYCLPHGIDSKPNKSDIAAISNTADKGKDIVLGYIKQFNQTSEGEIRIYANDAQGQEAFSIHLKNNGTIEIGGANDFLARFNELKSGFDTLKNNFNTHVQNYNTHVHPGVTSGGSSTLVTTTVSTQSTASIDNAKISEIKVL